jgi:hypothetical protein
MEVVKLEDAALQLQSEIAKVEWDYILLNIFESIQNDDPNMEVDAKKNHPIFFGCYDWHSAVHSHWALLNLMNQERDGGFSSLKESIFNYLAERITPTNVAKEIECLPASYELPYGFAWFMKLFAYVEAAAIENPEGFTVFAHTLKPLATDIEGAQRRRLRRRRFAMISCSNGNERRCSLPHCIPLTC